MIIDSPIISGNTTSSGSQAITGNLTVTGSIISTAGITGSLLGSAISASYASTASFVASAQSASNAIAAQTASYADALTVAGTLTAQTLVVQTITSSVDFVTGSTRFGSVIGNTHVFSGSVTMNPGGLFVSSSGNVGINTTDPTAKLTVVYTSGSSGVFTPIGVTSFNATTNVGGTATSYGGLTVSNAADTTITIRTLGSGHAQISTDADGRYLSFGTGNFVERVRITAGGRLQLNGVSGEAAITTNSTANVIGMYTDTSVTDGIARIEVTGGTYPSTPSTAFIRANTVRFTLNSASTETMRITSGGLVGINTTSPSTTLDVYGTGKFGSNANNGDLVVQSNSTPFLIRGRSAYDRPFMVLTWDISPDSGVVVGSTLRFNTGATLGTDVGTERMRISTAGVVTKPYQPLAMGAMAGDQSVSATTFTTIGFNTNYGFNQANVGSCWNNSTNTFTAPATGTYLINASLYTTNVGQIAAFINGSRNISMVSGFAVTGGVTWHGTIMIKMNSGDALTLRGYGDSGGTVYQNTYHTWFGIYFLG